MITEFLGIFVFAVCDNDDLIADGAFAGGGAIQANDAGTGGAFDQICFETLAVIIIDDRDLLVRKHIGGAHEFGIERERAFVIKLRLRDGGPMDFRFEQYAFHSPLSSNHEIIDQTGGPQICRDNN